MRTGAPGWTELLGVQATPTSATVRPRTSNRGNGRFIRAPCGQWDRLERVRRNTEWAHRNSDMTPCEFGGSRGFLTHTSGDPSFARGLEAYDRFGSCRPAVDGTTVS